MSRSQEASDQFRSTGRTGPGPIIRIADDRLEEAVMHLVAAPGSLDPEHGRRFLEFARQNQVKLDRLWSCVDHCGRVVQTVMIVSSPGRTGMVFASRAASRSDIAGIAGLIDHACLQTSDQGIDLAQALIDFGDALNIEAFVRGGFTRLATLSYLERPLRGSRLPEPPVWPPGVQVEQFGEGSQAELVKLLEATYEGTLDCPGLRGLRRTADILEGHRSCGRFDPGLWTLLRVDGRAVGVLMLNPSVGQSTVELVYLGLAPVARGRGLGTQLLRHGLRLLGGRSERSVCLAVDEANEPALRVYRSEGFQRSLRRVAMIRPLLGAKSIATS